MRNIIFLLFLSLLTTPAFAVSKVQKQGVKTLTDCTNAGGTAANCLIDVSQIYDTVNAQQLSVTMKTLQNSAQVISASNIDWSLGNVFTLTLSANTTFTFSNQKSGQIIVVEVTNTASNYTLAWPGSVKWPNSSAPTQTTGAHTDIYTLIYDGTNTYGNVVQNF